MWSLRKKLQNFISTNWNYIIIIIFGIILSVGVWGGLTTYLVGDDYAFHIARIKSVASSIKDGQILAQVSPNDMFGFGYGYNIFYGPLLPWVGTILRIVFSSWPIAINILCIILMCLAGIFTCNLVQYISKQKALSVIAGIFYMAAPYHLINLYDRFALAEFAGMALIPLLFLGLYQLVNHKKNATRKIAISALLLLLTHSLSTLLAFLAAVIYLIFNFKQIWNIATIKRVLLIVLFVLGGSAFFLLPLIEAKTTGNYGVFDSYYSNLRLETNAEKISEQHLSLSSLVYSDYTQSEKARDKMAIGAIAFIGLLGYWFVRKNIEHQERRFLDALYLLSILSLLMTTSFINWHLIPSVLYAVQFPWRFLSILSLTSSIISAYVIYVLFKHRSLREQQVLAIMVGVIAISSVNDLYTLPNVEHTPINEEVTFSLEEGSPGWSGEYAPVALLCAKDDSTKCGLGELSDNLIKRGNEVTIAKGEAVIQNYQKNGTTITCELSNMTNNTKIELPLIWYPGYKATINDQDIPVYASQDYGLVEADLTGYRDGKLKLYYSATTSSIIGAIISGLTCIGSSVWLLCNYINYHKNQKGK